MASTSPKAMRIGPTKDNRCWICREPLQQPARGRLRLTCSNACRQARYRFLHGKESRKFKREKKLVERRRSKPFIERRFSTLFFEPVLVLSQGRKVYECLACGEPYIVERIKSGNPVSPYCSKACKKRTKRHWEKFVDAYERAHQRGELDIRVEERFHYDKLSPLCPRCGKPFAPNTTLHGKPKRGRPRKYCSPACGKEAYEQRWKNEHAGYARVHRYRDCAECGTTFDRTDELGRRYKRFCGPACNGRFAKRAYKARLRMGVKAVEGSRIGHRIAARSATKRRQQKSGKAEEQTARADSSTRNISERINSGAL